MFLVRFCFVLILICELLVFNILNEEGIRLTFPVLAFCRKLGNLAQLLPVPEKSSDQNANAGKVMPRDKNASTGKIKRILLENVEDQVLTN